MAFKMKGFSGFKDKHEKEQGTKKIKVKNPDMFSGPGGYFKHLGKVAINRAKRLKEKITGE